MPGHARTTAWLLAILVTIFIAVGAGIGYSIGLPFAVSVAMAGMAAAFPLWFIFLNDQPSKVGPLMGLYALAWYFDDAMIEWISGTGWHAWMTALLAAGAIARVLYRIGWLPVMNEDQAIATAEGNAWSSADITQPAWCSRSETDYAKPYTGCRRRILQPWTAPSMLLAGGAVVVLLAGIDLAYQSIIGKLYRSFASGGPVIVWAGASLMVLLVANRAQRIHSQLLRAPGGHRAGIARRLVDAQILSSLELLVCLGGGAVVVWLICNQSWVEHLQALRFGDEKMHSSAVSAAGSAAIIVCLMLAHALSAPSVVTWLLTWTMPWWALWLHAVLGVATVLGVVFLAIPCVKAFTTHRDIVPFVAVFVGLLALGVVARFLAIRRLANAQPA